MGWEVASKGGGFTVGGGIKTERLYFGQETQVFFSRNPGSLEVVADDGYGDFVVGRDDNRAGYSGFNIGAMAAFLPGKMETRGNEDFLQHSPV